MATPITVGERIVLHLAQYTKHSNDFDAPFEVSQDGIGEALRISRAHAAIELKKLKEAGTVTERIAHIRAGPVKRKVYFLSEAGESKARNLKDFASRQGIEISPLLDLKKCKGEDLWVQLNPESRSLMAKAAVFRKPFQRSALCTTCCLPTATWRRRCYYPPGAGRWPAPPVRSFLRRSREWGTCCRATPKRFGE